jgi:hypothetical protein
MQGYLAAAREYAIKNLAVQYLPCASCGRAANRDLILCLHCKVARYCSTECQNKEWRKVCLPKIAKIGGLTVPANPSKHNLLPIVRQHKHYRADELDLQAQLSLHKSWSLLLHANAQFDIRTDFGHFEWFRWECTTRSYRFHYSIRDARFNGKSRVDSVRMGRRLKQDVTHLVPHPLIDFPMLMKPVSVDRGHFSLLKHTAYALTKFCSNQIRAVLDGLDTDLFIRICSILLTGNELTDAFEDVYEIAPWSLRWAPQILLQVKKRIEMVSDFNLKSEMILIAAAIIYNRIAGWSSRSFEPTSPVSCIRIFLFWC